MSENRSTDVKTLLIVDDEPGIVEMLQSGLQRKGYRVITALDGPSALEQMSDEKPDLVMLDIAMPGMTGWEVLDRIESNPATAGTPVIMLTALKTDLDMIRGLEKGAIDYITKPFDLQHLISVVHMILDKLDSRGQASYRQQLIAQRKHMMQSLQHLFPHSSTDE